MFLCHMAMRLKRGIGKKSLLFSNNSKGLSVAEDTIDSPPQRCKTRPTHLWGSNVDSNLRPHALEPDIVTTGPRHRKPKTAGADCSLLTKEIDTTP